MYFAALCLTNYREDEHSALLENDNWKAGQGDQPRHHKYLEKVSSLQLALSNQHA
jgi:hypothetical protein